MNACGSGISTVTRLRPFFSGVRRLGGSFGPAAGLLVLVTLLASALRSTRLDFHPLWWDEGYSVWFATHSLGQMTALTAKDIHPPLYYALLHLWSLLAGTGPVSLRLISVAVGVAAIPLMYVAAHRILVSRRAALLAASLLTINPLHVFYSQEIRMYGLVALLSTGVLWAAWRVLHQHRTSSTAVAYVVLTTLTLYTQYYAAFLPISLTLCAVWRWRKDLRRLGRWLGLQAVIAVLYLPWAIYAGSKLVLYVSNKIVADADKPLGMLTYFARHLSAFTAGHLEGPVAARWPLVLALLIPIVAGLIVRSQRGAARGPIFFLATVLGVAIFLGWLIGLRYPFFPDRGERLLLLALPAFVMLTAAGLDALLLRVRAIGYVTLALIGAVSAVSLAAFYTVPRYADDDYRSLIARTVEQGRPGDTVYCVYPWQVGYWRSYSPAAGPVPVLGPSTEWGPKVQKTLQNGLMQGRVWFPAHLSLGAGLETQIERFLGGRAVPFANTWYGPGTRLSAWSAEERDGSTLRPIGGEGASWVEYAMPGGDRLALTGLAADDQPAPAANTVVSLSLAWRANRTPPDLTVSVRLSDDLGLIWGQNDYEPLGAMIGAGSAGVQGSSWQATDRLGLLVPAGTPPGRYRVELVVLSKGGARPLNAVAPGQPTRSSVRLFDLEVTPADRTLGPERLPIATHQTIDLGDGLRFLGYTVVPGPLAPGELRRVNLFWQAVRSPATDYTAFLQLLGDDGLPVAAWEAPPGAAFATSRWSPATLIRTQASVRIPATLSDGRSRLIAGLFEQSSGVRAKTASGRDALELGTVTVRGRPHVLTAPAVQYATDVTFGSVARLIGYDLPPSSRSATSGDTIRLTLYWQALAPSERPYTVFVHLIGPDNAVRGYGDAEPGGDQFPTTGWVPGEYLSDAHAVSVSSGGANGEHQLVIGLYDKASGQRLTLPNGSDSFVLPQTLLVP